MLRRNFQCRARGRGISSSYISFYTLVKSAVFAGLILPAVFSSQLVFAHNSSAYSHDSNVKKNNSRWMAGLLDDQPITKISIPGTHDSMSRFGGDYVETQSMPLKAQLEAGIRAIDIRVRKTWSDAFAIHHGSFYQNASFGDVLNTVRDFLRDYPSETVLMKIQHEDNSGGLDTYPNPTSAELRRVLQGYIDNSNYTNLFWKNEGNLEPAIGNVRGKILLLRKDFVNDNQFKGYGIQWEENGPYYQDDFEIADTGPLFPADGLYQKWKAVRKALGWMANNSSPPLGINHLSATGVTTGALLYTPARVASGHEAVGTNAARASALKLDPPSSDWGDFPRLDCTGLGDSRVCTIYEEGINVLAYNKIKSDDESIGILFMDFPGPGLIKKIIAANPDKSGKSGWQMLDTDQDGKADFCRLTSKNVFRCALGERFTNESLVWREDAGYSRFQQVADVNGDGVVEFCREVGNPSDTYIQCTSYPDGEKYERRWANIDLGYVNFRQIVDIDGDGSAEYCRELGDSPNRYIRCTSRDGSNYGYANGQTGYSTSLQQLVDINNDGFKEFCREVGDSPNRYIQCTSHLNGTNYQFIWQGDMGYPEFQQIVDINNDGVQEFCREVGNRKSSDPSYILCTSYSADPNNIPSWTYKNIDLGYYSFRQLADIDGNGTAEYCRRLGDVPDIRMECANATFAANPVARCADTIGQLDAAGLLFISPAAVDAGSSSYNGEPLATLSLSQSDFSCQDIGQTRITLTVTDQGNRSNSCSAEVSVQDSIPPAGDIPDSFSFQEGEVYQFNVAAQDNCTAVNFKWTFADGTTDTSASPIRQFCGLGRRDIEFIAEDLNGNALQKTIRVDVTNNPPVVNAGDDITGVEGSNVSLENAWFSDSGLFDHRAEIDWGEGDGYQAIDLASPDSANQCGVNINIPAQHVYAQEGLYTISLRVYDAQGASQESFTRARIANQNPIILSLDSITGQSDVSGQPFLYSGELLKLELEYSDAGVDDRHQLSIDWGETLPGSESVNLGVKPGKSGAYSARHAFFEPGNYLIKVTIEDDYGAQGTKEISLEVKPLSVRMDFMPSDSENLTVPGLNGPVAVVLFSGQHELGEYRAEGILTDTLRLGKGQARAIRKIYNLGSIMVPGNVVAKYADLDGDGKVDVQIDFNAEDIRLSVDDAGLILTGKFTDGRYFEAHDRLNLARSRESFSRLLNALLMLLDEK